jgi:hypothetical protein
LKVGQLVVSTDFHSAALMEFEMDMKLAFSAVAMKVGEMEPS